MTKKCDRKGTPRITFSKTTPYLLSDMDHFFDSDGSMVKINKVAIFCRCGKSEKMPFCDGTHAHDGMDMDKSPDRAPDKMKDYKGKDITVHFNLGVCSHDATCLMLTDVFEKCRVPWILPDNGTRKDIIETIKKCPSGALSYTVDGIHQKDLDRVPAVRIEKGGPLKTEGFIELRDDMDSCPESAEHYCLCRCGESKNHPFCDGAHMHNGFDK